MCALYFSLISLHRHRQRQREEMTLQFCEVCHSLALRLILCRSLPHLGSKHFPAAPPFCLEVLPRVPLLILFSQIHPFSILQSKEDIFPHFTAWTRWSLLGKSSHSISFIVLNTVAKYIYIHVCVYIQCPIEDSLLLHQHSKVHIVCFLLVLGGIAVHGMCWVSVLYVGTRGLVWFLSKYN